MSFCTDPNSIIPIDISECVGNSLTTMNTNFNILNGEVCDQYTNIVSNESEKNILTSRITSLSSQLNLMPKCSVKFDDQGDIVSSQGINFVTKISTGVFQIFFSGTFNDNNYLTIASSVSEIPCIVSITEEYSNYITINARNNSGNLIDPNFINLTFFSNNFLIFNGFPIPTPTPTPTTTPSPTPTPTPTPTPLPYLFALGPGGFDGTNYFSENASQQINMTANAGAYRSYFYDNYDGNTLSYTNTVVVVNGTPVASISHTTDRIGDQFGFSLTGSSPVVFGTLTGGNVYLTTGGTTPTSLFALGPGTFDGSNYFSENASQQINMTSSGNTHKSYFYDNYDGNTLSYTSTVVIVNGTPVASISHTTDRIGDQFGYSTSGLLPQAFSNLTGGNVYLTI